MRVAIISLGSKSSRWTAEALRKYFEQVDEISLKDIEINFSGKNSEVLYRGVPLGKYDCIYAKGSFRYAPLLRSASYLLTDKTYMPIKPSAFTIAHDKLLTQLKLQQKNIPMPKTYLSATTEAAKNILKKINYPIIMKFPQGTQGKGVMFADSFASASSMLDALSALKQPFLIQEYVETGGVDFRAIVIGDKVVAAMKRKADANEIRANIHAGGVGETVELDSLTKKVAVDAARAIGADICGVDMLESTKGAVVIEVNISPGLQGISSITKTDIADLISKFLYKKTVSVNDENKTNGTNEIMKDLEEVQKKEIISQLDFRGTRILLPEVITNVSKLKNSDNVEISAEENKVSIKKFDVK
jgi:ribosomal protein S6--L-glutamate ligase